MATLTDRAIQGTKATSKDLWVSDGGARGAGRLYLRVQTSGRRSFYYRCSGPDGDRQSLPLGEYIQKGGRAGLTLTEARDKAGELARLYLSGIKDLRGHLEAEQCARERSIRVAEEEARRQDDEAKRGSLRNLLNGYVEHLERAEKVDWKDVQSIFRLHVFGPFPDLVNLKASDVKSRDLREVLARVVDAGKGRTAGKLRSYLRAAFAAAAKAEFDPTAPSSLIGFGIEANPCDVLPTMSKFNVARERTLNAEELRLYLNGIDFFPLMTQRAMRLALYLGGQRPTQLLRVKPSDVDLTEISGEIRLRDPKGSRKSSRLHVLPLVGVAREIVGELMKLNEKKAYLFQSIENSHLRSETVSAAVFEIATALVECGRSRSIFQGKDIRRTSETMLAGMGVSKDVRAQLLSHGLSGVQDRHYDRHEYADEKRAVLTAWNDRLEALRNGEQSTGNVIGIERARVA